MIRQRLFRASILMISPGRAADGIILLADQSPVSLRINHVNLVSRENDNSRFQLTLDRTRPFPHDHGKLGLRIGEKAIRFSSGGYLEVMDSVAGGTVWEDILADEFSVRVK